MPSPLDAPLRNVGQKLVATFGLQVTLRRETGGTYDTSTREVAGDTEETQTVRAISEKYKARFGEEQSPEAVRKGDRKLTIAAKGLSWAPETGHRVTLEGKDWKVLHVHPVYSGEQVTLYELHVRR